MSTLSSLLSALISGSFARKERRKVILSFDNGAEKFTLPVTPKEFSIGDNQNNTTVNITEAGELNLLGFRNLKTLSLESFFPNGHDYPFIVSDELKGPYEYVAILRRWKESHKPIRVIISRSDVNLAMGIEGLQYGPRDGSGDVYFSLSLKEYRFLNVPSADNDKTLDDTTGLKDRPDESSVPDSVNMKPGQDVMDAAKKAYGDYNHWRRVAESNSANDLAILAAGGVLKIK